LRSLSAILKTTPAWPLIEPVFTLFSLYVVSIVIAYQFIEYRYRFTPELPVFLHSYNRQADQRDLPDIRAAGARARDDLESGCAQRGRLEGRQLAADRREEARGSRADRSVWGGRLPALAPHRVSHITIKFLERPVSFDDYAFAYIVYELNRSQTDWHFMLDSDPFNRDSRTSKETR